MSQILAGFVELAIPSLERVVVVLERARSAPQEVRAGLAAAFERADMDLIPQLEAMQKQGEMFLDRAASVATEVAAVGARKPRRKRSTPVPVTRGSGGGKTLTRGAESRVIEGALGALHDAGRLSGRDLQKLTGKPGKRGRRGPL